MAPAPAPAQRRRPVAGGVAAVVGVGAAIVAVDQLTKAWALDRLDDGDIDLWWTLRLHLVFNRGSAFSLGQGWGPALGIVAAVVAVVLVAMGRRADSRGERLAVGLVLGGAVGNLVDRAARADDGFLSGAVVDFVDLQWWPVFNVADAAICVGVVLLVARSGRRGSEPARPRDGAEPAPSRPDPTP